MQGILHGGVASREIVGAALQQPYRDELNNQKDMIGHECIFRNENTRMSFALLLEVSSLTE